MKKHLKIYSIWLCVLLLGGCVTTNSTQQATPVISLKPYIDQAIWPNTTKDKVYAACLTALHMEGFDILPLATSKESGIIIPKKIKGVTFGSPKSYIYYKLQILVAEVQDNRVMVDIKVSISDKVPSVWDDNTLHFVKNKINNRVSGDLGRFFTRMDLLLGKAESRRDDRFLNWE
ncbi:MAG: hypothetical protein L6406_01955 [Desulfobacterales bacterium]|nr:hypothetical protein [Desulfobacterales bacterium]